MMSSTLTSDSHGQLNGTSSPTLPSGSGQSISLGNTSPVVGSNEGSSFQNADYTSTHLGSRRPSKDRKKERRFHSKDLLLCLERNSVIVLRADEVWVSLHYTGNNSTLLQEPSQCSLHTIGVSNGTMSLLIFNVTCFTNNSLFVNSAVEYPADYDCDPMDWVAPGLQLLMKSNDAYVTIAINEVNRPFSLHAQFKTVFTRPKNILQRRDVTRYLGMNLTCSMETRNIFL